MPEIFGSNCTEICVSHKEPPPPPFIVNKYFDVINKMCLCVPLTQASKEDIEIIPVLEFCVSDYMNYWLAAIFTYKGLLLVSSP